MFQHICIGRNMWRLRGLPVALLVFGWVVQGFTTTAPRIGTSVPRRIFGSVESYDNDEDVFPDFDGEGRTKDQLLDFAIDSFLRGDYDHYADDAPAPHPGLTPQTTVEAALQSLRRIDDPQPSHGAAVLMRFCVPLSRGERWGDSSSDHLQQKEWKQILRGSITPTMCARRIRNSEFSCLLDWERLDVTKGAFSVKRENGRIEMGVPSSVAFVNAALYFEEGAPKLVQFTLRKINGVWLIDDLMQHPQM